MQTEFIEVLPHIFSWKNAEQSLASVQAAAVEDAGAKVQCAFNIIESIDAELADSLRNCLCALPSKSALRFITAPETQHRISVLRNDPAGHISFLCSALTAERAMHDASYLPPWPCWTALGDFYFAVPKGSAAPGEQMPDGRNSRWQDHQNFRSPLVADAVPVDFASPHAQSAGPSRAPFQPHTPEEARAVWTALQDTFTRISSIAPITQLITTFVKVIIPRKDEPAEHSSSSMTSYPGRMLLRNVHLADSAMLASSMIHESIHHFLYAIECRDKFVSLNSSKRVVSAWTGRELTLHSYLHACFVWYGLAQFWLKNLDNRLFSSKMALNQLAKALRGFEAANPVERLLPYASEFNPEALEAAHSLRNELRKNGAFEFSKAAIA
jgi:hypothetical protein